MRRTDDRGAVAPVALALAAALLLSGLVAGTVVEVLGARQRAADVADLAALAAVSSVLPTQERACDEAAWVARRQRATVVACSLVDGDARVEVAVALPAPVARVLASLLGREVAPRATARAGRR